MKELQEKLRAALEKASAIAGAAEKENRDFTAEERVQVQAHLEEARDAKKQLAERQSDADLRKSIADLGVELAEPKPVQTPNGLRLLERGKSLGEQFVEAAEFKSWLARFPNGHIPDSARGIQSPPIGFRSLLGRGQKDLLTGGDATSGGAFVNTDFSGIFETLGRAPLTLRGIVTQRNTTSDTIEYVRQTSRTNNAAPTAEAVATDDGSGEKPEGAMEFEKVTTTVKTIAEWIPATKRAISDAQQLRGLIDDELRADLEETLEDQIINGNNTGEEFEGLDTVSGTQDQAYDTDLLVTTRKARTKVRTVGRAMPTAYLFHPNDWETIQLTRDATERFYFAGPADLAAPRLWGLPVVESEACTEGSGWVGDFRKIVLWDREQAAISVSDSHADFFIRNMVAILAEMRAAMGVIRPTAFVEIDLTP